MYSDVRARPRFFIEKVLRSHASNPAPAVTVDGLSSTSTTGQVHS
jgi:undecaprenyl-phosphate 4-deoxy-4-formamido-L-arabinose transferase